MKLLIQKVPDYNILKYVCTSCTSSMKPYWCVGVDMSSGGTVVACRHHSKSYVFTTMARRRPLNGSLLDVVGRISCRVQRFGRRDNLHVYWGFHTLNGLSYSRPADQSPLLRAQ